jgi:phosphatidate cytidylyltransferase
MLTTAPNQAHEAAGTRLMIEYLLAQPKPLLYGGAGVLLLLLLGSAAAFVLPAAQPGKWTDLRPRMQSWWVIVLLVGGALVGGWAPFTLLMAFVSFVALKEFLTLAPTRREDRPIVLLAYAAVILNYWAVWIDHYPFYLVIAPIYIFLATAFAMAWIGRTEGFLATVGIVHWGVIVCVYNLGYLAVLMRTPNAEAPAGAAGLVFLLIFMTQFNDVAQYCWGKALGRSKITPSVSPNKTWEGAAGGWITTAALFTWLAPYFIQCAPGGPIPAPGEPLYVADGQLQFWERVFIGATLPILGFAGDITMSAVKRDLGVKDMSRLIPGHGGALDRLDSLTFAAPWFFHWMAYFVLVRY